MSHGRMTLNDVKRVTKDRQTRAYCKHLIVARDQWEKEAEERSKMEQESDVDSNWSDKASAHAYRLDKELNKIIGKLGACVHGHVRGTPAGDLHRSCVRMGSV